MFDCSRDGETCKNKQIQLFCSGHERICCGLNLMRASCARRARGMRALARQHFGIRTSKQKIFVRSSDEKPNCVNMRSFSTVVKEFCCVGTKLWDPSRSRRVVRGLMRDLMREEMNASANERKRNEPGVVENASVIL